MLMYQVPVRDHFISEPFARMCADGGQNSVEVETDLPSFTTCILLLFSPSESIYAAKAYTNLRRSRPPDNQWQPKSHSSNTSFSDVAVVGSESGAMTSGA